MLYSGKDWLLAYGTILSISKVLSAIQCQSRYYCRTDEVKYAAMERIENTYLNATPLIVYNATSVPACQKYCLRQHNCSSLNIRIDDKSKNKNCHLLAWNKFSNTSLLVNDGNSTHFYIPSPCDKKPCLNGGTCIPFYANDSYSCECSSSTLSIFRGRNCEVNLRNHSTAFVYWSFDDPAQRQPQTSSSKDTKSFLPSPWVSIYEPGRKTRVAKCTSEKNNFCMQFDSSIPCINNFVECKGLVTYSIWLKFSEKEIARNRLRRIFEAHSHNHRPGVNFYDKGAQNLGFKFVIGLTMQDRWTVDGFGKHVDRKKWNHFVLVVDNDKGVCTYINGVKDTCGGVKTTLSLSYNGSAMMLGGAWVDNAASDFFVDDFAVWQTYMTEEEVKVLYNETKM